MPFKAGNQYGKSNLGRKKDQAKTLWLLESFNSQGFNFETKLVMLLEKAIKGDRIALEAAHLMVKMLPHVANPPKQDVNIGNIDQLVINRYDSTKVIEPTKTVAEPIPEGNPPFITDGQI